MNKKWLIVLILFFLAAADSLPLLETKTASAESGSLEIAESSVNVRSGPGLSYSVSGSVKKGEKLAEVSRSGDWIEVKTDDGTGWVASWLTVNAAADSASKMAVSSVNRLNVRSQPELSSAVLVQMDAGDQATVVRDAGEWLEVDFRNTRGFVSKQYISISENTSEKPASKATDVSSFEIAVDTLNVRTKADLTSSKQGVVQKGEVYPVLEMQGNWVKIQLSKKETGWAYAFYGHLSDQSVKSVSDSGTDLITVQTDGTNLRAQASTSSEVVSRANAGDKLPVVSNQGDWYEVSLPDGQNAFIASWVVASGETVIEKTEEAKPDRKKGTLNGVTIVLDPGHGGNDSGTIGARKTQEKDLTLKTAELLSHHLQAAGADVRMTRQSDVYVGLRNRVSESHQAGADAFISIHYDATNDNSVSGFTSYYMHSYQKELAGYLNSGIANKLTIRDRGVQLGNYLVLRENRQAAVLVELGFLSNYSEERLVTTNQFREQAALGLYSGIINYFDAKLAK